jgi:diguanylate cyclase (GGDEF)-like protein
MNWTNAAFIFSVITNAAVFFGGISFVDWIWANKTHSPFFKQYGDQIEMVLGLLFQVYLIWYYLLNHHYNTAAMGRHWTALNLMIVSSFIFNLLIASKWQFAISAVLTCVYVAVFEEHFNALALALVAVVLVGQWLMATEGWRFWRSRVKIYAVFAIYGAAGIGSYALLTTVPTDASFWVRQVLALAVLAVCSYEYFRMLLMRQVQTETEIEAGTVDGLTGINNFGTFNADMQHNYQQFSADGAKFAIYEFDIDWFKRVNDTHGHIAGNEVLKRVGQSLADFAQKQPQATAYRLGGEEFCLVVHDAQQDTDGHWRLAKQLKQCLDGLTFADDGTPFSVTVSMGQAEVRAEDLNYLDVYKRADRSLYEAKRAGRNRININGEMG